MSNAKAPEETTSYFSDYIQAYNSQSLFGNNYLLSPIILNTTLKNKNMNSNVLSTDEIRAMVMRPHLYEHELRRLSLHMYRSISVYKQLINYQSSLLDFNWEPIPYVKGGKTITQEDMHTNAFKRDYAYMKQFFDCFDKDREFKKVLWNMLMYDTYYTAVREYDDYIYLQEMPYTHCIIDAESYLGYLYSFDLSYFMNSGVDINAYPNELKTAYTKALKNINTQYNPNLPTRNGSWVHWIPLDPDNYWVFKFNSGFAGSVPPTLDAFVDYSKIDKYKDLEDTKKELETYKVIFATVPRMSNGRGANKIDDFAISADELGKFVSVVKENMKVDFKAAPLEDFKAFDFQPSSSENDLLETELTNILTQSGLSSNVMNPSTFNVSSANFYKAVSSAIVAQVYPQFGKFCEHQINRKTKKYKFKIKFSGTLFDREERRKNADSDANLGLITPSLISSRGMQITDVENSMNLMYAMGYPDKFKPVQLSFTMSNSDKANTGTTSGATKKSENELSDKGAETRDYDNTEIKKEGVVS